MRPTHFIPVAGTWDWDEDENKKVWYEPGSHFLNFMNSQNFFLKYPDLLFEWSTGLEGLPFTKFRQWKAGGKAFLYYLDDPFKHSWPLEDRNIIAHSYGLYVVLYYLSWGGKIRNLISVGSPIRNDMKEVILKAKPNIKGTWLHLRDDRWDFTATLGQFFDKHIGLSRHNQFAHREDALKGVGHSDLLKRPEKFYHWLEGQRLEVLRNVPLS